MVTYETNRENYDRIVKKYKEYVALYKKFNHGSAKGCTPFTVFYWRFTFLMKYEDPQRALALRT